jgi:hypothetical protein
MMNGWMDRYRHCDAFFNGRNLFVLEDPGVLDDMAPNAVDPLLNTHTDRETRDRERGIGGRNRGSFHLREVFGAYDPSYYMRKENIIYIYTHIYEGICYCFYIYENGGGTGAGTVVYLAGYLGHDVVIVRHRTHEQVFVRPV